jgi:hypothetical protein
MKIDLSFYNDLPVWLKTSLIIGILVATVVGFFAVARYTDKDDGLCQGCHPVIHQMWEESHSHPADQVTCYECHTKHLAAFPEDDTNLIIHYRDKIIPIHFKSGPEVLNANCLRCHPEIPQLEEVKKTRIIKISHKKHFKGQKVKIDSCLVCHYAVAHDKYSIPTNRPRMQGCFAGDCHKAERNKDRCELCHFVKLVEKGEVLKKVKPAPQAAPTAK